MFDEIKQQLNWRDVARQDSDRGSKDKKFFYCEVHGDKNSADMQVYSDGGARCHARCGSFRDLIHYVAERDFNGDNVKAAKHLIQKHNLEIESENISEEQKKKQKKERQVRDCQEQVIKQAQNNLETRDYSYLKEKRGWTKETIYEMRIGRLDNELFNELKDRYGDLLLQAGVHVGMTGSTDRGCYLIPHLIKNGQPNLITARDPKPAEDRPKYIQSKSTDYVQNDIYISTRKSGYRSDTLLVTEGYPDAISGYQSGLDVVAAGCGSFSGNRKRLKSIASLYENVLVVLDNDQTGVEETRQLGKTLSEQDTLIHEWSEDTPEKYDLDDWTTENGFDLQPLIEEARPYLDILVEKFNEAGLRERSEVKEEIFQVVKEWGHTERNYVFKNEMNATKSDLTEDFQEWRTKKKTEQTEQTEQTEANTHKQNPEGRGVEDEEDFLNRLANEKVNNKKSLIGKINNTYFVTAWITDKGLERPAVITSNDNVRFINYKLDEKKKQLADDKQLTDEQREKYDYWYAEIDGEEVQFKHPIPKRSKQAINNLDNRIIKYVTGEKELRDKEKIFDDARNLIDSYWSHYHDEWYDISVAYDIHTYLISELGYTAYMLLKGRPQTGKTTWQKVNSQLCFNGCFAGNLTPATAVRYAHSYFATLHQDEMEKQSEERRNQMQGLYNTGQRKGGVYNITNTDAGTNIADQIQEIQSFCAKTMSVNDIYGFADSFMSRNVILKTVKTKEKGLNDPDSMTDEEHRRFKELQAEIAYFVLKNREEIIDEIETVRADIEDTARDEDKMALFKGIVQYFKGEERAEKVEERIRDSQRMQDVNKVGERVTLLFEEVASNLKQEDSKLVQIRLKTLADCVNKELDLSQDAEYRTTSKSVLKKLKEYDIVRRSGQKKQDSSGYTAVEVYLNEFLDACDRYEMSSIYEDLVSGEGSSMSSQEESISNMSQSAQFAQSAQNRLKYLEDLIEQFQDQGEENGVEEVDVIEAAEEHFDEKEIEKGLKRLKHDGEIFEPEPGKLAILS